MVSVSLNVGFGYRVDQRPNSVDVALREAEQMLVRVGSGRSVQPGIILFSFSLKTVANCVVHHGVEAPVVASEVGCSSVAAKSTVTPIFAGWFRHFSIAVGDLSGLVTEYPYFSRKMELSPRPQ
ncbi:hypothetical protein DIJ64_14030 [Mycobacterium leprae]|uniref:Uncharacterized protein n=1 Tax=Mycobacterium leprae TaxID=1769 RepID=A0AAD0P9Q0_MYCLR|nr:hypothetical protein DIJ64_14030 [Mycobacterium leprae]OAR20457.1 hypothetical protein A8144_02195 [Mycobacterium leprae 3125609]OAX72081.1 hypothetical protein A3216_02595 [Mycobacterium leprae 7935681]